jgi:hypothetical protein
MKKLPNVRTGVKAGGTDVAPATKTPSPVAPATGTVSCL